MRVTAPLDLFGDSFFLGRKFEQEKSMKSIAKTALLTTIVCGMTAAVSAQHDGEPVLSRYMGGPAELVDGAERRHHQCRGLGSDAQDHVPGTDHRGGGRRGLVHRGILDRQHHGHRGRRRPDRLRHRRQHRRGEHIREAIGKISDKPIKVIIYSHSHYALGGGALVDNPDDVMVIGHPTLNDTVKANLQGGGAPGGAYGEIGPVLTARAVVQMNNFLPEEGPDARLSGVIPVGIPISFLPATVTPEHGQTMDVLGIEMQFLTNFISDDHNLTVWIPEKGIVLNNFYWPGTPNLYTLRGGVYRDPRIWRDGLAMIRDLEPEALLNTHARPVIGKEEVMKRLTGYMDMITLTFDQTLRGILGGLGPDEIRHEIYYPPHLTEIAENAQTYGESIHFPAAIYQYAVGWFDNDVTELFRIHPDDEAERMVALMGGRDKVIAAARNAFEQEEYAWAAQVIQYAYRLDPTDKEVRQLKADILRPMGHLATGSIPRAFLLSEARALEGDVTIPRLIPPTPETIFASPATFVDYFRVRIDPKKSQDTDKVLEFVFADEDGQTVGLHVRRGIAEFLPEPADHYQKADFVLQLDAETWAKLYLSEIGLAEAIDSNAVELKQGNKDEVAEIFAMFDRFEPARNITIPSPDDLTHR
jgi:alkyl sulfatase BDS1-like metallo-beta-lactamase superfamily hydrolase